MNREEIERIWRDDENWTWGMIYRSPMDPRRIVPRRLKWCGWTLNFGHPKAGVTGLLTLLIAVGPSTLVSVVTGNRTAALIATFLSVLVLIYWSYSESNRTF